MELRIWRNGKAHYARFEDGETAQHLRVTGDAEGQQGTEVRFLASTKTFSNLEYSFKTLEARLRELAFLNSGVKIVLRDERPADILETTLFYDGGVNEFVRYLDRSKNPLIADPILITGEKDGIEVEGVRYGPIEASLDKVQGSNVWLTVGLKEGKNREVKRVLAAFELTVNRLIRLSFGPFQVGELAEGEVAQVPNRVLMDQLGNQAAHFEAKGGTDTAGRPVRPNQAARPVARQPAKSGGGKAGGAKKPRSHNAGDVSHFGAKKNDGPRTLGLKTAGAKPAAGRGRHPERGEKPEGVARKFAPKTNVTKGPKAYATKGDAKPGGQKSRADVARARKPNTPKKPR